MNPFPLCPPQGFLGWVAYLGAANAGIPLSYIVKTYGWGERSPCPLPARPLPAAMWPAVCHRPPACFAAERRSLSALEAGGMPPTL